MNYKYVESEDLIKQHLVRGTEAQLRLFDVIYEEVLPKLESINSHIKQKPEYLSVGQVALLEGVCEKTIRNRIKEGTIPATKNKGEARIKSLDWNITRHVQRSSLKPVIAMLARIK